MASKRGKKKIKKSMDEETVESPKNVTEDLQVAEEVEKHGEDQVMLDEDNVSSEESVQCDEMVLAIGKSLIIVFGLDSENVCIPQLKF